MSKATKIYLEIGQKRVFACAAEWPGWCRSAKSEEQAIDALVDYADRYAIVTAEAGIPFLDTDAGGFYLSERLAGSAGYTDFGAPGSIAAGDREPLTSEELDRQIALLRASWAVLFRVASSAPSSLRKGPRGGGRDRDEVLDHVLAAETAYARKVGVKQRQPSRDDLPAITALHDALIAALRLEGANAAGSTGWPPRYAIRRIAWHVVDHLWEIEDRSSDRP